MTREWFYFGCYEQAGHYLHRANGRREHNHPFVKFDGSLCLSSSHGERVAALTRFCALQYSALAFWDYSIDNRSGSNSIIFAPGLTISAQEIVDGATVHLPLFAKRWPSIDVSRADHTKIQTCSPQQPTDTGDLDRPVASSAPSPTPAPARRPDER